MGAVPADLPPTVAVEVSAHAAAHVQVDDDVTACAHLALGDVALDVHVHADDGTA